MTSVCVYENTWPTCSEPLTVGGGVSIEYTWSRGRLRSNQYVPSACHRAFHFDSRPSSAGLSGREIGCAGSSTSDIHCHFRGQRGDAARQAVGGSGGSKDPPYVKETTS